LGRPSRVSFQIRSTKSEIRNKSEARSTKQAARTALPVSNFEFRISFGFGASNFEFHCSIIQQILFRKLPSVDLPKILISHLLRRAVVDQLAVLEADDALAVLAGQVEEVQVDQGGDAQLAVDAHQIAHDLVGGHRVE